MRRICIILILLPWIFYGCATHTNKIQFNANNTHNIDQLISKMLANNERIALIYVVAYSTMNGIPNMQSKIERQSIGEYVYLNHYGHYKNFTIVSRNYLKNNLDEITLSASGLISNETRVRIGELTGATHLLLTESNSFYSGLFIISGSTTTYSKLIDIQSGKLLASDRTVSSW